MKNYVSLQQFKEVELLFDKKETILILKFIFKTSDHELIESLEVTNRVRAFAQGLLVEAVDASYGVGYVEALFKSVTKPAKEIKTLIKQFGKKALKHWFKHAAANDLMRIEIYDFVRDRLAINFRSDLYTIHASLGRLFGRWFTYDKPSNPWIKVWG